MQCFFRLNDFPFSSQKNGFPRIRQLPDTGRPRSVEKYIIKKDKEKGPVNKNNPFEGAACPVQYICVDRHPVHRYATGNKVAHLAAQRFYAGCLSGAAKYLVNGITPGVIKELAQEISCQDAWTSISTKSIRKGMNDGSERITVYLCSWFVRMGQL